MPITVPILLILSLIFSIYSVKFKKVNIALVGALFGFPAVYYLVGTPVFSGIIIVVPLFQLVSAYYIHKKNTKLAWLMLIPLFLLIAWMIGLYFL